MNILSKRKELLPCSHHPGKLFYIYIGSLIAASVFLYFLSQYNYLIFHLIVEIFEILIFIMIFIIANRTRNLSNKPYIFFLGNSLIFVAVLTIFHTLTYKGMNLISDSNNISIQLWIASRYLLVVTFLLATFFIKKKSKVNLIVTIIYFLITGFIIASIFWLKIFPDCYIAGVGLTKFKIISEYVIISIMIVAWILHRRKRKELDSIKRDFLRLSFIFIILSELCFTFYFGLYDIWNIIGHILKIYYVYFIFLSVFITSITAPYQKIIESYDETLEGWVRALDIRDKETKGHSKRVVNITIRFAQTIGIKDKNVLTQIRRGALLHDIGKLGIPDKILLKNGPLDEAEWKIMKKHPFYAYRLISPIEYLKPSVDIPYYHHEKWDGTGYPKGLKGEKIPLPARLFSIIDVYDALNSNRPYRPAWSSEKICNYFNEQKGISFDPNIVDIFLKKVAKRQLH
jgi:HD-GYP domain-containing protein (c-di-GMP phosphodiesterase class II)